MPRRYASTKTRTARQKRGPQEIGVGRIGASTKVHVLVDALGNPVRLELSPGQAHEMRFAQVLLKDITNAYVAADKAYDSRELIEILEKNGCTAVIPANHRNKPGRPNPSTRREIDKHLYRERFLIENFFQRIKRFRRVATRFEKLARNYLAFLHLVCALVWLL